MNVFLLEIRRDRKSLITWVVSLTGLSLLFMMMYPSIAAQMDNFMKVIESFPVAFREAFGMTNVQNGGLIGYYSVVLIYVLVAGSIQAMNLGVSALSEEVRDKTADFLYSKPISRQKIITAKILAVFLQICITNLVYFITSWLTLVAVNRASNLETIDLKMFLLLTGSLLGLQLFFACLGLFVSSFLRRIRTVLPISMGVVFFFYILFILNQTLQNAELAFLSPFSYFELAKILNNGVYEGKYMIAFGILILFFIVSTYRSYMKKDLPSI